MAKDFDGQVADFRHRPVDQGTYTFVTADALVLKVRESGRVANVHACSPPVTDPVELRRLLAETRYRGYAAVHGWMHDQAAGVAVPIRGPGDHVVAALSLIVPNKEGRVAPVVPALLITARGIGRALGEGAVSPDRATGR